MPEIQTEPAFVNLQSSSVQVFDEKRHPITVQPFERRHTHPNGVYVVHGGHYQQFVSGRGPLAPFPASGAPIPRAMAPSVDELQARAVAQAALQRRAGIPSTPPGTPGGRDPSKGAGKDVEVRETTEGFAARIRRGLAALGIKTRPDFEHASRATLLSVAGVTEDNVVQVREMAPLLFPAQAAPAKGATSGAVKNPDHGPITDDPDDETDDDEYGVDPQQLGAGTSATAPAAPAGDQPAAETVAPTKYARTEIETAPRAELVRIVETEGFEIKVVGVKTDDIRAQLLTGLTEYEQLT